jgi:hypothetical protein
LKLTETRKRIYGLIAVVLVFCLLFAIALTQNGNVNPQQSNVQPQATTVPTPTANQTIEDYTSPLYATNQNVTYDIDNPTSNYPVDQQNALAIAKPYIEAYAKENNRTIIKLSIKSSFIANLNKPNMDAGWKVSGTFEGLKDNVTSYAVLMFADSGVVHAKGTLGYRISEQQALNIAHTRIDPYVAENQRTVKTITAKLTFVTTVESPLGEPRWYINAEFTDVQNYITGYHVSLMETTETYIMPKKIP